MLIDRIHLSFPGCELYAALLENGDRVDRAVAAVALVEDGHDAVAHELVDRALVPLDDRAEEVEVLVEEVDDPWIFEALVAQPLADMGPVLLFDMSIVVLLVGSRAGELDRRRSILKVPDQMPLEELGSVIAIEAKDCKGQRSLDGDDLLKDTAQRDTMAAAARAWADVNRGATERTVAVIRTQLGALNL